MDSTKQWFNYLHLERKLSVNAIGEAKLSITNGRLTIPIMDKEGKILFCKYRKEPWDTTNSPKYLYEKGGTISLYGVHLPSRSNRLIISEGELEILALRTAGYDALSSTGGTMSWQPDWVLDRVPTILFDNDEAGIKGAVRTALIIGKCIISWIPSGYGKDAGDVLRDRGKEFLHKLVDDPVRQIPIDLASLNKRKDIAAKKKELQAIAKGMSESPGREIIVGIYKKLTELEKALVKPKPLQHDAAYSYNLQRAKDYPIEQLLKIERHMATCPFHNNGQEKTPSFSVKNNRGFCFGGCEDRKPKDAIDIYMKLHNVDHTIAVKTLSGSV